MQVVHYQSGPKWITGVSPLSYLVQVTSGLWWRRHVDQLLAVQDSPMMESLETVTTLPAPLSSAHLLLDPALLSRTLSLQRLILHIHLLRRTLLPQ